MVMVAFLVDIALHLNELSVKLQYQNNSVADLMTAVHSLQRKLDIFSKILKILILCKHFSKRFSVRDDEVDFINKLIGNCKRLFFFTVAHANPESFPYQRSHRIFEGGDRHSSEHMQDLYSLTSLTSKEMLH